VANAFTHAKLSTFQISGNYYPVLTVKYTEGLSDLSDITYTVQTGATWQVLLPGYNKATIALTFVYDTLNQPVLSPQSMIPGVLATLVFSPDGTKLYSLSAYSESLDIPGGPQVKGPVISSVTLQSSGTVTRPLS
jgi:hypothetical protein